MRKELTETFLEMLRRASTDLPPDVEDALGRAHRREAAGSPARGALKILLENVKMARENASPLCQDTGTNTWWIVRPKTASDKQVAAAVHAATRKATRLGYLRPNSVDPVTGENSGDNIGVGHPVIHVREGRGSDLVADVLLKGGGCENVSSQTALPEAAIGAGRDLDGVWRAVLAIVQAAQGRGCAPGALGVCVGGDRATGYATAKEQLLHPLSQPPSDPALARLGRRILRDANALGIGPMGFGGKTTLLGVRVARAHRLPASFFVTVAYSCWSLRRAHAQVRRGRATFATEPFGSRGAGS
jgi:fumarate hydratase class I